MPAYLIVPTRSAAEVLSRFNDAQIIQRPEQKWGFLDEDKTFYFPPMLFWATHFMFILQFIHPGGILGFPHFARLCSFIKRNDEECGTTAHDALKGRLGFTAFWLWAAEVRNEHHECFVECNI
jgi:hypothetical protein